MLNGEEVLAIEPVIHRVAPSGDGMCSERGGKASPGESETPSRAHIQASAPDSGGLMARLEDLATGTRLTASGSATVESVQWIGEQARSSHRARA